MAKMSQHDQLIVWFVAFIVSFCILMAIIVYRGYKEEVRGRVAIEGIFKDINPTAFKKHMENYE